MTSRLRRSRLPAAFVATLMIAACGSSTPTPSAATPAPTAVATPAPEGSAPPSAGPTATPGGSPSALACPDAPAGSPSAQDPSDPNAAIYDAIEQQVRDLRGLPESTPVERDVFDTAELCAYFRESFRKQLTPELVRGTEVLYQQLGLIPQDTSLEQLYLDLLTSQTGGLYDDETRKMYVVASDDNAGPLEKFVYAHEYDHAITDQAFGLRQMMGEATDQGDRSLARSALAEGDATLLMYHWAQGNMSPAELLEVVDSIDPSSQEALASMPAILKDPLGFPYNSGFQMALKAFTEGGGYGGVNELYQNPPDSTEQVLHPEKLAAREAPVQVAFPDDLASRLGDGWKVSLQDTFGELQLEIILRDHGATGTADAAAGWGGDRVALIEGPSGETAVVIDTAWDTEADADEFAAALEATKAELASAGKAVQILRPEPSRVVLVSAESPDTLGRVANVLGLAG